MKRYLIDDKEIAKPPYGGPAGKPLPDKEVTDEEIAMAIEGILGKPKKSDKDEKPE